MQFSETRIPGVFVIDIEAHEDERGFCARSFCQQEFAAHGIRFTTLQCNISRNTALHTLRGMHMQREPWGEAKLVRCTRGAIYDVAVDLRPSSPSYCRWVAAELTAESHRALFIPEGCAHGFLTLSPEAEVFYQMGTPYRPGHGFGVRFDDPAFGIDWPHPPAVISDADRHYPDFTP